LKAQELMKIGRICSVVMPRLALAGLVLLVPLLSGCSLLFPVVRAALPFAGVKLALACVPGDVMIDTPSGPRAICGIAAGDTVIGFRGLPVLVEQKHEYRENPATGFLRITFGGGEVVEVCGMHRVDGRRAQDLRVRERVAGREVVAIAATGGYERSYDLLTGDEGYRIGGIPVNSMIEEMHAAAAGRVPLRN
jgi:hypothetical protein